MLAIFSLNGMMSAMFQLSFAAIQTLVIEYFQVTALEVNMLSMIFMALYIPTTLLASWCLNAYGLRIASVVGAVLQTGGAWLRWWGALEGGPLFFWVLFVGQSLAAAAQPFVVNGVTLIAGNWFGESERTIAVTIGALTNVLGAGMAFGLAPTFVTGGTDLRAQMALWMLIMAGACSVVTVLVVVFLRSRPPTPPSSSAGSVEKAKEGKERFIEILKKLFTNVNYLKILMAFSIGYGALQVLATVVDQVFAPVGFNDAQSGMMGVVMIGAGTVGSFVFGFLADRTRRYYVLFVLPCVMCFASFGAVTLLMQFHVLTYSVTLVCMGSLGFFALGLLPVCLEMGVEVTYPMNEGQSTGFLYLAISIFSLGFTFITTALQAPAPPHSLINGMWFLTSLLGACVIFAVAFNGRYHRLEYERAKLATGERQPLNSQKLST